ncbi:hypothetical protein NFI96_002496 [Prochilodus magdalenae]|nr:hypothetical protein NFI96_002496 [Prochilodus magdalenae]
MPVFGIFWSERNLLTILIITSGVFGADVIRPSDDQETDVLRTEGEPLTLKCSYETSSQYVYLYWYRHLVCSAISTAVLWLSGWCWLCLTDVASQCQKTGCESCVSQSISPLEEKVDAVEGQTVTLSCSYEKASYLFWYRQYPGSRPEYLLSIVQSTKSVSYATPRFPRLDGAVNGSVVDLEISSAAVSDSVLYCCALRPTVTGNPDTLYRNWFYD